MIKICKADFPKTKVNNCHSGYSILLKFLFTEKTSTEMRKNTSIIR